MIDPARFAEVAEATRRAPTDLDLFAIAVSASQQQQLEADVATKEKELAELKASLAQVVEHDLPDAMAAVGMTDFTLDNGYRVTVADEYYANIPSPDSDKPELLERRFAAFAWLHIHHPDLPKAQIVIEAGRGEQEKANRVMNGLDKAGIPYRTMETVHFQTLKAFVKEQMNMEHPNGEAFPEHLFGVCVKRVAKVKPATTKKIKA
jgi:hypothetical protein